MIVLTHPDLDHGGGLGHILENFMVSRILGISDVPLDSQTHQRLHAIVKARDIPYAFPYAGKIELTPAATLNLLHPIDAESTNLQDADKNDDSLVMKISYGEVDVLFTGDIGKDAEARLITSGQDLRSENSEGATSWKPDIEQRTVFRGSPAALRDFLTRQRKSVSIPACRCRGAL